MVTRVFHQINGKVSLIDCQSDIWIHQSEISIKGQQKYIKWCKYFLIMEKKHGWTSERSRVSET